MTYTDSDWHRTGSIWTLNADVNVFLRTEIKSSTQISSLTNGPIWNEGSQNVGIGKSARFKLLAIEILYEF